MPVLQNNPKFESSRASTPTHVYDLRNRDFRKKPPIGHFCKFIPKSCQEKKSQIIEVHREYKLNSTPETHQPMYRGLYIDELLSYTDHADSINPQTYYVTTDRQFSVRTVVDSDGNIVEERNYSPMGVDLEGNAETSDLAYGFTGRRYDAESDLYYFRARYYSSELGQFISRDPLMYIDGMNVYAGYFARSFKMDYTGMGQNGRGCRRDLSCAQNVANMNSMKRALDHRMKELEKWNNPDFYHNNKPAPKYANGWPSQLNKLKNWQNHINSIASVAAGLSNCELVILEQWLKGKCDDCDLSGKPSWEQPVIPPYKSYDPDKYFSIGWPGWGWLPDIDYDAAAETSLNISAGAAAFAATIATLGTAPALIGGGGLVLSGG